jgi:hypothetical protein
MVRKGQVRWIATDDVVGQAKFIAKLFVIARSAHRDPG